MTPPRILIVTYYWPPLNLIASHRPYWWAWHFARQGAQVTVYTIRKTPFDGPIDLTLPAPPGVRVIEVACTSLWGQVVARCRGSRAWHILRQLARKGGVRDSIRPNPARAWLGASRAAIGDLAASHDVVISTYGPAQAHTIGSELKRSNEDLYWIADYRDLWSLAVDLPEADRSISRADEQATVAAHADLVVSISPEFSDMLSSFLDVPAIVITNGFDVPMGTIGERLGAYRDRPATGGALRIVYTGTLYPEFQNHRPLFEVLIEMAAQGQLGARAVTVDFYGAAVDPAKALAREPSFAPFIRLMGYVPREAAIRAQVEADLLLMVCGNRPNDAGILTGKVFEYLAAGVPILTIGGRAGWAVERVVSTTRCGHFTGPSAEAIEAVLTDALSGRLREQFAPDLDMVAQYHRLAQAEVLWQQLSGQVHQSSGGGATGT